MLTVNVYIIVIYDVITVDYCKCILLYSPLNSYLYVHWILDFKLLLLLLLKIVGPLCFTRCGDSTKSELSCIRII